MSAYLGEFEQLVLLAILQLGPDATGGAIRSAIADATGRNVWIGAVHTTLERLEGKELLRSSVMALPSANGRKRKVYGVTPAGRRAVNQAHQTWLRMTRGLKLPLGTR